MRVLREARRGDRGGVLARDVLLVAVLDDRARAHKSCRLLRVASALAARVIIMYLRTRKREGDRGAKKPRAVLGGGSRSRVGNQK